MIYALVILVAYLAYVLYLDSLKYEFTAYIDWLPEWFQKVFKTSYVFEELKLIGYELLEVVKGLLLPLKTLGTLLTLVLAPLILPVLMIVYVIIERHNQR